jgi:hypothetical protein
MNLKGLAANSLSLKMTQVYFLAVMLVSLTSTSSVSANDRRTATFQIDFKRTLNEKELRLTLRNFNVKLVRASNNASRSQRWTVDIETRDSDYKVERELKATSGVERVKRVVIKSTGLCKAASGLVSFSIPRATTIVSPA